jgi:hypothetical protein
MNAAGGGGGGGAPSTSCWSRRSITPGRVEGARPRFARSWSTTNGASGPAYWRQRARSSRASTPVSPLRRTLGTPPSSAASSPSSQGVHAHLRRDHGSAS